ncbi:MAG: class I SAM-dependent methyltransferase [Candidatus Hermodarchaeia archaeon]|jgi:ubiquinone/menaquinone biosynthesis C-methylase UbiE
MENLPGLEASGAREIASKLKLISGGKVLDVCTGEGDFISTLMQTLKDFESFIGVDISLEDLETARKEFEGQPVQLLEMNAESLNFDDNSFDTVSVAHSLRHLQHPNKALAEMKRVLKPGGHLIVLEMYQDGEQEPAQLTHIVEQNWSTKIDLLFDIRPHAPLTRKVIKKLLEPLNFQELTILESSRYVKCLFCAQRVRCEDPLHPELVDDFIEGIDSELARLEDHDRVDELKAEGEKLKERVKSTGIADASHLFIIGR